MSAPSSTDDGNPGAIVRELTAADTAWARGFLERVAGAARMVSRGRLHQCELLPGFYAEHSERRAALLTYRLDADEMEVVALYAEEKGRGHGTALLEAALGIARARGCRRVWLVTTNDNEPALRFYRNRGMRLAAVHHGAVDAARRELKPEIPLTGFGGAPIRDEVEFEIMLDGSA
jgi:ribosomal protein S18 acetylase RimI-like enzyme